MKTVAPEAGSNPRLDPDILRSVLDQVAARAREVDRTGEFPEDVLRAYREAGLMAAVVPTELGGLGLSHREFSEIIRRVAQHSGALSLLLIVQAVACLPLVRSAGFQRREEVLGAVAREGTLLGFALTESTSGSDAYNMRSEVVREDGSIILTGSKSLITLGNIADACLVFARDRESGSRHISAYLVDARQPGYRSGSTYDLIGMRGIPTSTLHFDRVVLDPRDRIGGPNDGVAIATDTLNVSRPWIAAQAVGLAQGALEAAVQFACTRIVMGEPLADKQGIRFMIAEAAAHIEAADALTERASSLIDAGVADYSAESAMSKLFATEMAVSVCERAVQILGGPGCIAGNRAERAFRDAKITQIYEGSSEVQKILVGRQVIRKARSAGTPLSHATAHAVRTA